MRAACANAPSVSTWRKALTDESTAAIRSKCACVNSVDVTSPFDRASDIAAALCVITQLHQESVERENVVLLVQVRPRALVLE